MFVHFVGANLNLYNLTLGPDDRCMQGLVIIAFGHGDVIIEFTGDGLPQ